MKKYILLIVFTLIIGAIYFLMELLSGALFALCYKVFGISPNFFLSIIIILLSVSAYFLIIL